MSRDGITITVGAPGEGEMTGGGTPIQKYGVGRTCRGRVVGFKPYGFFVETEDGGFGLVYGGNVKGWDGSRRFDRVFRYGMELEVKVVDIENGTNRLSFSCEMPDADNAADSTELSAQDAASEIRSQPDFQEIADEWIENEPDRSREAFEWLKGELEDGPMYGPLTNVLCDRFGVPVPVSRWIRRFPEFTCYSGKGDNPSDLPAVALSARAGDVEYWKRMKTKSDDLTGHDEDKDKTIERYGLIARRLDEISSFPGSAWIRDYMRMCRSVARCAGVYGAADTVERLAIPMLGQIGWDVSRENAAIVRGGGDSFDVVIYGGPFGGANARLAMMCAPAGVNFDDLVDVSEAPKTISERNVVERLLCLYNQLVLGEGGQAKVVWTNGVEWVILSKSLLDGRIGIIADRRGKEIMNGADGDGVLARISFPLEASPMDWLASFLQLQEHLGC